MKQNMKYNNYIKTEFLIVVPWIWSLITLYINLDFCSIKIKGAINIADLLNLI